MTQIKEVPKPTLMDFLPAFGPKPNFELPDVTLVGSGKGAIDVILQYLTHTGVVKSKIDELLVPHWLGYWVYNQMQSHIFPAKSLSERTRAIFVYHQYGFPQNMERIMDFAKAKNLIVIEDCAHAVKSFYQGRRLGWMGDYAVFSFSKWFFCNALGGVRGSSKDFSSFSRELVKKTPIGLTVLKNIGKLSYELTSKTAFLKMTYSLYGQALKGGFLGERLLARNLDKETKIREKRYQYFLQKTETLGVCAHLPSKGVTPYVIPIIPKSSSINKVVQALLDKKIKTGIYHFDVNRNMLEPNFVPCVWVPCHGAISDSEFDLIIDTIKKHV